MKTIGAQIMPGMPGGDLFAHLAYTSNFRATGCDGLLIHGTADSTGRKIMLQWIKGVYQSDSNGDLVDAEIESIEPRELVKRLKEEFNINLADPNKRNIPIYLVSCMGAKGGTESTAQRLANATKRIVKTYSKGKIDSSGISALFPLRTDVWRLGSDTKINDPSYEFHPN